MATFALAAGLLGCGPGASLQPLIGETPDAARFLETPMEVLFDDAPTLAARSFLDATLRGRWERAWAELADGVQMQLRERLPEDERIGASGRRVLEHALQGARGDAALERLLDVRPIAVAAHPPGDGPISPPPASGPAIVEVYLYVSEDRAVALPMHFDGSHWRVAVLPLLQRAAAPSPPDRNGES